VLLRNLHNEFVRLGRGAPQKPHPVRNSEGAGSRIEEFGAFVVSPSSPGTIKTLPLVSSVALCPESIRWPPQSGLQMGRAPPA
jgi:hypothetical protein